MHSHSHGRLPPAHDPDPSYGDARAEAAHGAARRRLLRAASWAVCGLLTASPLIAAEAHAQAFPTRPVRIITPYPTGLTPDIATRLVAEKLSRYWNQQVVVESRPGGNGFIAITAAAQAPADGHTLLMVGNAHVSINPHLFKKIPYDAERDFTPLSTLYQAPFFLAASADGPYRSVKDIVAAAASDPNRIAYSSPYVGSPPHFGGAVLANLSNTRMLAVQYKEGQQMYAAVANGDVAFSVATIRSFAPLVDAGKLKVLAVAAPKRLPAYPDIPTVEESGGPAGLEVTTWTGLVAPRGVPADIVERISADIARALNEDDVKQRFTADGVMAWPSTPTAMAALLRDEHQTYRDLIKRVGLQAE
ncbi:Tripartite tricarboxylate transporter family receptor [Pigmentiphaga humi]|uniref:Tripartite tricarboxylate transporter family receptor n=1 Tax=Pigmentiphaga humi TaxID=2478468 RepID=A0A3P4AZK2_9BURK|nr:tripartite tricarboxylate transporter substrate binding protein [Pigmentiphaga humi]VCU68828.1 Tripartite tricarboxylate transporter family receptor [Pigmentiphaga humi]